MMPHLTPRLFARIAAVGLIVLIVAFTVIQSWHSEDPIVLTPLAHDRADALIQELARCRTITSDEAAALETCRRVWAENRRQFFGVARLPQSPSEPVLNAPAESVKNQGRVLPRQVEQKQGEVR
jgi:conjugative transfer region protein TrbK